MTVLFTPALVTGLVDQHPDPVTCAAKFEEHRIWANITTRRQVAKLAAQFAHEAKLIPTTQENLNYSVARLMQVWPGRFPTVASAAPYAFNPVALGNKVYANRMGNGDEASGDGYTFRGSGIPQLTGRANSALYGPLVGFDLVRYPSLLLQYGVGARVACAFWKRHGLNEAAEAGDVEAVTRVINGGTTGLDDRERLYQRAVKIEGVHGLLNAKVVLDPVADAQRDLVTRNLKFEQALSLLGA